MEMARAGSERRRAAKAKRVGGKEYVTPLPKRKSPAPKKKTAPKKPEMMGPEFYRRKQTPKRKIPAGARSFRGVAPKKAGAAPRTTRTGAQRAADKKALLKEQKAARKESAGMRHGSEYKKPPPLDTKGMEKAMTFGAGAGAGGAAVKLYQMYKVKRAADLLAATAKAKRLKKAADKAAEKTRKGYEQFEKDRKARSRKMGRGK